MRLIDADILRFYLSTRFFHDVRDKDMVCETINAQPTIDSVRKGEWRKQNNEYSYWYECSECGCEPLWSRFYGEFDFSAFCPNCGAKMEGGD